ncbi:hypothetical protein OHA61_38925 [Streptomyces sp. NBC_00885]|uniref:hypothetical protein n=1 Tax=Streptomyces sp. NBC_00885 TaxID=2975857 RepID=UPI0038645142|nr:hypothetical protein OHA61_38925 [Streptomyces sp. NBC_00885]
MQQQRCRARWPLGKVCASCYGYVRSHPRPCATCGRTRPLIGPGPDGRGTCGECSGAANAYLCVSCGSGRETDRSPRCARCILRERLADEFTDSASQVPAELRPLTDALLRVPKARSILVWLDKPSGAAACLRQLVAAGIPLSHEALDAAGPGQGPASLRATLIHLGILPPRNEALAALKPWLERILAELPSQHRHTLRAYAEWSVLRQARRRAARTRFTSAGAARVRHTIRCAAYLLTWLSNQDLSLADLTQTDVDRWLSEHSGRRQVGNFLRWAHHRNLTGEHEVPDRPRDDPHRWWDQANHWAHLQRCLRDEALPLDVRAAGSVMLLYGIPITRITELTATELTDGNEPSLILGKDPVLLPPAVHRILRRQADQAQPDSAIGRTTRRTAWIFPGYAAGTRRSAATLARKLRRHGLPAHPARNTALLTLASDLPASVLSEALGISITSALGWTRRAARDWNAYLTSRPTHAPREREQDGGIPHTVT